MKSYCEAGRQRLQRLQVVRAAAVVTMEGQVLRGGQLWIEAGRIAAIESAEKDWGGSRRRGLDLGQAVLLPGLINGHCHLELSGLAGRIRYGGDFAGWLVRVMAGRPRTRAAVAKAVRAGADASLAAGVTCVADISYRNRAWPVLREHPIRAVCFAECLGIGPRRFDAIERLRRDMDGMTGDDRLLVGISPHAPYSVAAEVYRQCLELARRNGWLLTTHLSETRAEVQFVRDGKGSLYRLLRAMGLCDASVAGSGLRPVAYAKRIGLLDFGTLLAHVNYLDESELELLADSPCSVVYCPRSHRYFGHRGHRFRQMLEAGVNVCIGTDGLASSPSLSVLEELRLLRRRHRDLPGSTLLAMATINGARALGLGERIGSLKVGKRADIMAIPLDPAGPAEPLENILRSRAEPILVAIDGQKLVDRTKGR